MDTKRVVIIDDEAPARYLLNEYLAGFLPLKVVGECCNGIDAIQTINQLKPDVIFLDIQMPGKSGFEVLQEINYLPNIIFTTAHDEFALKAFEVNAVDYLLKPYTKERFYKAVNRAVERSPAILKNIQQLTENLTLEVYPERFVVEVGNKLISIPVQEILYIEANGDYTKVHTPKSCYISNKSMNSMEGTLNPQQFQRVHRSTIISMAAIKAVCKKASGKQVILEDGTKVSVSRTYYSFLKNFF